MILVAAMAVGTLAVRSTVPWLSDLRADGAEATLVMQTVLCVQYAESAFNPYLATVSVALPVMRLRRLHPGRRRIGRQRGLIACSVVTTSMAIEAAWIAPLAARDSAWVDVPTIFAVPMLPVSFSVAGGWIALAISGQWQADPGWIDRVGRTVGFAWIAGAVVQWSSDFLLIHGLP